jgi:adenosine deaminase
VHTGEEGSVEEMRLVVERVKPDRVGHGFLCVKDEALLQQVVEQEIVIETCITSNLRNRKIHSMEEMRHILHTYLERGVKFTLNTDGPELYRTNIYKEHQLAINEHLLTEEQVQTCTDIAFASTFIRG